MRRFISGFHFEPERPVNRGGKVVRGGAASERRRGLQMDYLCSDSWMEKMTPDVEDFCWMEAKKVNSLFLLKSCTTLSVMCAGAWMALPTSEGNKAKWEESVRPWKLLTGDVWNQSKLKGMKCSKIKVLSLTNVASLHYCSFKLAILLYYSHAVI